MSLGIGVRYNGHGVRVLALERGERKLQITGLASGTVDEGLDAVRGFAGGGDARIAVGLAPGQFLSATASRDDGIPTPDMEDQLRWEIERKMISGVDEYVFDFVVAGEFGCAFAGRRSVTDSVLEGLAPVADIDGAPLTDVEPVALYNGAEGAGHIGTGTVMLISLEAEGTSSIVVRNGELTALESVPVNEEVLLDVLPPLDLDGMKALEKKVTSRMAHYVVESLRRLTSFGNDKSRPTPDRVVLAGGGAYLGNVAAAVSGVFGLQAELSDPLKLLSADVAESKPDLVRMGAAFTTCFGLALRALED